jgi:tetratricopeptide (TPR) repeat protein
MLKRFKSRKLFKLNNHGNFTVDFAIVFIVILTGGAFFSDIAINQLSTPEGMKKGGKLLALTIISSLPIAFIVSVMTKVFGGGQGPVSRNRGEAEILRGHYKRAQNFRVTKKYDNAVRLFKQILRDFPEELHAQFHLGEVLWRDQNKPKQALRSFIDLEKRIKRDSLDFEFHAALNRHIENLKEELQES